MKKIISFLALCAVFFVVALAVTGCGNKSAWDSVWKVMEPNAPQQTYICFHSDGNLYRAWKDDEGLQSDKLGKYKIDSETKHLIVKYENGTEDTADYNVSDNTMTTSLRDHEKNLVIHKLKKSSDYTEAKIKESVGK